MKIFLFKTVLFASLITSGSLLIDYIITEGLKLTTGKTETAEWAKIISSRLSADIIISGTSRAEHHFSPAILDSVLQANSYNFGMDGMPFSMQLVKLKLFEKYNTTPKLIIQEVDLTSSLKNHVEKQNDLLPFVNEDLLRKEFKRAGFSTAELCMPTYRYTSQTNIMRAFLEYFHLKHFSDETYKGYDAIDMPFGGLESSKDSVAIQCDPEIVKLFDSFLSECKDNNIKVILVFTPQHISETERTKNWGEGIQIYHDFAEKYDIPFLDYTHNSICYDTLYFHDVYHLNKKGAEIFSLKLANDIKEQNLY